MVDLSGPIVLIKTRPLSRAQGVESSQIASPSSSRMAGPSQHGPTPTPPSPVTRPHPVPPLWNTSPSRGLTPGKAYSLCGEPLIAQEGFDTLKEELGQLQKTAEILREEHRKTIDLLPELGSMYQ